MDRKPLSRRGLLSTLVSVPDSSGTVSAGTQAPPPGRGAGPGPRPAPRTELVNVLEYEVEARRILAPAVFADIAGSDRAAFDRITLRPRAMVPTTGLDLTAQLFGQPHFAPILVAPMAGQERFHAEGELATARGSAAAKATMIVSGRSKQTIETIAKATTVPPWFQVFDGDPAAPGQVLAAVAAGCKVIVVTVGARVAPGGAVARGVADWASVAALVKAATVPVVVKGVTSPEAADAAIARGAEGVVVSDYGGRLRSGNAPLVLDIARIADRVKGKVPVFVDGNFRRGTDILKALALGATGVLVGRPVLWGLAAYGSDGVQGVLEMLQTELARYMAMSGRPALSSIDRTLIKIHER